MGASRGQSAVVGYVMVIGLSLAVVGVVVAVGAVAIADVEESAQANQAESAMTQFDSTAAEVALGESPRQSIRLGQHGGSGSVEVDESAGEITVTWIDEDDNETKIAEDQFGKVVYESGDRTVAYQGGGVFRAENGWSKMVSPPEYHYRDRTLTFPIVKVEGDTSGASPGDQFTISESEFDRHFPNETHSNPLEGGHVHVEVTSDYHHGWKQFFETRTEGSVTHDPANRTVWVNLTVPFEEQFANGVATTSNDPDAVYTDGNASGGFEDSVTQVDRPSASPNVEERISHCESEDCDDLNSTPLDNGTYYADNDTSLSGATYDTSDGDIQVVVDGDLELAEDQHNVTGDGKVTFYVNGSVSVSGSTEVNPDGSPGDVVLMMHTDAGNITVNGQAQFTGYIYAPGSELEILGGGNRDNIVGAAVVERAYSNGNGKLVHEPDEDFEFELDRETISYVTYLHVTENRIEVSTADN
ncbi:DUF7289 family protein [Halalkaliarchaeum desulfuricum]|nr:collagen-binding domain-containing protein [Halalkaliarchaeum desulfuricum]